MSLALRLVALAFVTTALILLGLDLITTLETGRFTTRSISDVWRLFDPGGPERFLAWMAIHISLIRGEWLKAILAIWAWAVAGPLGCALVLVRDRRAQT